MCLSQKFKKVCIEEYGCCSTLHNGVNLPKPVKDEVVAIINIDGKVCSIKKPNIIYCNEKPRPKEKISKIKNLKRPLICLVLESPHIKEYSSKGEPFGPALSTTGKNISIHLEYVIGDALNKKIIKLKSGDYLLKLVEAISFQCSNGNNLAEKTKKIKRNDVFNKMWDLGGKKDFIKRIKKYNPVLIINASTGGLRNVKDVEFLNGKISASLSELDFQIVYSSHPSSYWFSKKGLKSNFK